MKFGIALLMIMMSQPGIARSKYDWCAYERVKMYRYKVKSQKWNARRAKCEQEQQSDRSRTCFWEIKLSARYERKFEKWMEKYQECDLTSPAALTCDEKDTCKLPATTGKG